MNKTEIMGYLLGTVSIDFLISFYLFSLLGVILSMLFHYGKKRSKDKKVKEHTFNFKYWLKDNLVRLFTSIICIYLVVRFYDVFHIDYELNMFLGLLVGMGLDQLIVLVRNKTSINIFQTKS